MFTVTVGISCWGLGEHEPLIISLFLPIVSRWNWKGPLTIRGIDWLRGLFRVFELEWKMGWE